MNAENPSLAECHSTASVKTHYRNCNLCEAACGLEIKHQDQKILSIKADKLDPISKGAICPKATALEDLYTDPDRLKQPVRRTAKGWVEISWDEALDEVANKLKSTQKHYGNDAVALFFGNPCAHNYSLLLALPLLVLSLDSKSRFSPNSLDSLPHLLASLEMFGNQTMLPVADVEHADTFVCIGANPLASKGSLMSAPDISKRFKELQKRGGKLLVIDPRRTETAEIADQHIAIKPATDPYLLLSLLNVIFSEGWETLGQLEGCVDGLETLKQATTAFTPEKVSPIVGIDARVITELAKALHESDSPVVYGRLGLCAQEFGGINIWLLCALNIVIGCMDKRGGMMFPRGAIDLSGIGALLGVSGTFNRWQSRVNGYPEFFGETPAVAMAEEILTEGEGQIKVLLTLAGNPELSVPGGKDIEEALQSLDFMVSIDFFINETTRHADIILPPTTFLEQDNYDLFVGLIATNISAKYSEGLFRPGTNTKTDFDIILGLVTRLDSKDFVSGIKAELRRKFLQGLGPAGMLDLALRLGPYGKKIPLLGAIDKFVANLAIVGKAYSTLRNTLAKTLRKNWFIRTVIDMSPYGGFADLVEEGLSLNLLKDNPHGIFIDEMQPCFPQRIFHKNRRISLAPELYLSDLHRLNIDDVGDDVEAHKEAEQQGLNLLLIGRRHVRSKNSWLHNSRRLVKGKHRCTVLIHPDDASAKMIKDGSKVTVKTRVGTLVIEAEVTDEMMPGVISIPHGWGHNKPGVQMTVAQKYAGVSVNDITDNKLIDKLTGTAALYGVPASITAATDQPKPKKRKSSRKKVNKAADAVIA